MLSSVMKLGYFNYNFFICNCYKMNKVEDDECDYCGGSGVVYIDDDEWEECDFCCESECEPESSDSGYDTDESI